HLGDPPEAAVHTESGVRITLQSGKQIETEMALVTVGRFPVSRGIGLNRLGLDLKNGYVQVNQRCQTNMCPLPSLQVLRLPASDLLPSNARSDPLVTSRAPFLFEPSANPTPLVKLMALSK
ncbi:MAG: FAD-dependent oxidoreductase, partial [Deltaproteobacteria bacterium]|nr:FAD-dependent oxidoreductase [Deltaproteobacteria bacterium]